MRREDINQGVWAAGRESCKRITRTAAETKRIIGLSCCPANLGGAQAAVDKDVMRSPDFRVAVLILVLGLLALGVAFGAQDVLGMAPCELCLWERWPYRVLVLVGVVAICASSPLRRILLWLAALTLLCGAGIGFLHLGVERHWWPSPLPECAASNLLSGSVSSLIASLPAAPAKPCDAPNFLIPGLPVSFATMDFILAAVCAVALGTYLSRSRRG
jgi:disulfide bond formation protein DsbB